MITTRRPSLQRRRGRRFTIPPGGPRRVRRASACASRRLITSHCGSSPPSRVRCMVQPPLSFWPSSETSHVTGNERRHPALLVAGFCNRPRPQRPHHRARPADAPGPTAPSSSAYSSGCPLQPRAVSPEGRRKGLWAQPTSATRLLNLPGEGSERRLRPGQHFGITKRHAAACDGTCTSDRPIEGPGYRRVASAGGRNHRSGGWHG